MSLRSPVSAKCSVPRRGAGRCVGIGLASIGLLFGACRNEEPADRPTVSVEVARPLVREVVDWDEYFGRLSAVKSVGIKPRVDGYLESIHFEDGQLVEKGELLFVIDPRPYRSALAAARAERSRAQARTELARSESKRANQLLKRRVISDEQMDEREATLQEASATLRAAEAEVETNRLALEFTRITAPISGRVGARSVDVGNLISVGSSTSTPLTTIVSLDPIYCDFDADERDVLKYIRLGITGERVSGRELAHPVLLGLVDEEGFPHTGELDFIDNRVDPNTGTMRARAVFPNPDHLLVPGMFGRVQIAGSGRYQGFLVPGHALATDLARQIVFVVNEDGQVATKPIEAGPRIGALRVIRSGLEASDRVIVSGVQQVRPGQHVDVTESKIEADPKDFEFADRLAPVKSE